MNQELKCEKVAQLYIGVETSFQDDDVLSEKFSLNIDESPKLSPAKSLEINKKKPEYKLNIRKVESNKRNLSPNFGMSDYSTPYSMKDSQDSNDVKSLERSKEED